MKIIIVVLILVAVIIWERLFLPKKIEKEIMECITSVNGKVIRIQNISSPGKIYLVEYRIDDNYFRKNVKYGFLGEITEWI